MIRLSRQFAVAFAGVAIVVAFECRGECLSPELTHPNATTISEGRVRLEWKPVAGATAYLLWLESRVPEGRVLATHETQTATTFWVSPEALTEGRVILKGNIKTLCGGEASNHSGTFRFPIDLARECVLGSAPTIKSNLEGMLIQWGALASSREYAVEIRSAMDGHLFSTSTAYRPGTPLKSLPKGVWIVGVKPRCGAIWGNAKHVTVAAP